MRNKPIVLFVISTMVVVCMLCMVGCAPTEQSAGAETSAGAGEITEDQILNVAISSLLGSEVLDPVMMQSADAQNLVGGIFESLATISLSGEIVPYLAKSWTSNDDYTVWTLELQEGVQFHDGWGEMTADDVKFSIERFAGPDSLSTRQYMLKEILKEIIVLDKYKLEIHLNSPMEHFVEYYLRADAGVNDGMVMSKAYWDEVGKQGFDEHPIGTGRWEFVEFRPGDGIVLDAVTEHWTGEVPGFKRAVMMEVPEEGTRIAMLKRGAADLINLSPDMAEASTGEMNIMSLPVTGVCSVRFLGYWHPDAQNMPISNVKVREALSIAIDRKAITDMLFDGLFDPVVYPGVYTNPGGFGVDLESEHWQDMAARTNAYDPERAKQLLEEAGYGDGFEVTFWAYEIPRAPWQPELIEVIASYWDAIGVKTNITTTDYTGVMRPRHFASDTEFPVESIGTISMHTQSYEPFTLDRTAVGYASVGPPWWPGDYSDDAFIALGNEVEHATGAEKLELFDQFMEMITNKHATSTILYSSTLYGISDKVGETAGLPGRDIPSMWIHYFQPAQ